MNYCPNCGDSLSDTPGATFCPGCGTPLPGPKREAEAGISEVGYTTEERLTPSEQVKQMTEQEKDELLLRVADEIDDERTEAFCRLAAGESDFMPE